MNRESERKRLVELLRKGIDKHESTIENYVVPIWEFLADHLLDNGIVVPPVKVWDVVYAQKGCFYLPHATQIKLDAIITCEVIAIKGTKKGKYILLKPLLEETVGMRSANGWFPFSSLGKTVFTSREDAENALRKEGV